MGDLQVGTHAWGGMKIYDIDLDGARYAVSEARVSVSRPHDGAARRRAHPTTSTPSSWVPAQLAQQQIRPDLRDDRIGERIRAAASEPGAAWCSPKANAPASLSTGTSNGPATFSNPGSCSMKRRAPSITASPPPNETFRRTSFWPRCTPPSRARKAPTSTGTPFLERKATPRICAPAGTSVRKRMLISPRDAHSIRFEDRVGRRGARDPRQCRPEIGRYRSSWNRAGRGRHRTEQSCSATGDVEVSGIVERADVEAGEIS